MDAPWPVQVGVSDAVADALGLQVGDRLPAKDEFGRTLTIEVSGTFVAVDEDDRAWQVSSRLLDPVVGTADDQPFTSAAALVSSESLPDLRFALPGDDLTRRVVFTPEPQQVRWRQASGLERDIASLQTYAGLYSGEIAWDSRLGSVLRDGRAQVASARGQADVLVVGLVACALLVLVLGAQLLVARQGIVPVDGPPAWRLAPRDRPRAPRRGTSRRRPGDAHRPGHLPRARRRGRMGVVGPRPPRRHCRSGRGRRGGGRTRR